ncbi:hypothetical protein [Methylibium sp.]|uniref:hypothetical protein n=1 Tax=Methylibium sp. TaxID=2067992 RepID=UPI001802B003|nr:hypothetical protein [Methylibium sp.]MBA3588014.1 hypothetical protein [Methylibium sp.]
MTIARRKFLGLGVSLAAGATALYTAYKWRWGEPTEVIVAILHRRVGDLRVDAASFDRFATEYVDYRKDYRRQLSVLSIVSLPFQYVTPYGWIEQGGALRRLEDNVVSLYLLSTDFFLGGADESRPVSYLSFYDPYASVCRNPFMGPA